MMTQALPSTITYLQETESESRKHLLSKAAAQLVTVIRTRHFSLLYCKTPPTDKMNEAFCKSALTTVVSEKYLYIIAFSFSISENNKELRHKWHIQTV